MQKLRERPLEIWLQECGDKDGVIRLKAVHAVGMLGAHANNREAAIPVLARALTDADVVVSAEAAIRLGNIVYRMLYGMSYVNLGEIDIASRYGPWKKAARETIERIAAATLPALIKLSQGTSPAARQAAADALGWMLTDSKTVIPVLAGLLKDPDVETRRTVCRSLWYFSFIRGPRNIEAAFPALLTAIESDSDRQVRERALESLGVLRPPADVWISALQAALQDTPQIPEKSKRIEWLRRELETTQKLIQP